MAITIDNQTKLTFFTMNNDLNYFKYEYDPQTGILYKYYFGGITIDHIEESWKYAFENNLIPENKTGFIIDYQQAFFRIKISKYDEIGKFYRLHPEVFGGFKIAILTQSPKDVVVPVLVMKMDEGYYSQPFCTEAAAVDWILS